MNVSRNDHVKLGACISLAITTVLAAVLILSGFAPLIVAGLYAVNAITVTILLITPRKRGHQGA